MNLATNASQAMQESGGQLHISLKQRKKQGSKPDKGDSILLKVIDTGSGIEKEILNKIFDPYFTTKQRGKGTGLGLSVVQGIVDSCNGEIQVLSQVGKGTEIRIFLPVMKTHARTGPEDMLVCVVGGSERVLLVDDEQVTAQTQEMMIEKLGYKVTSHTDCVKALEQFKTDPYQFDIVITDMTMPKMTGIQFIDKIKTIRTDIPAIICTGYSEQINKETSEDLGFQGYISKPVRLKEIAHIIRQVLDRQQSRSMA